MGHEWCRGAWGHLPENLRRNCGQVKEMALAADPGKCYEPRMTNLRPALLHALLAAAILPALVLVKARAEEVPAPNTLTSEEKAEGWQLLFDGEDLSQFRNYRKDDLSDKWQVADGAFTLVDRGGGDIITRETFGAFELKLEYRVSEGGNSGIMYHVTEEEARPWQTGPEVQILDNPRHRDPQKSGWLYQLYAAEEDATRPPGEWNDIHILITPEQCVHYLNGVKYVEYVKGSEDWDERVAKSKFAEFENFGKATEGHIALQDHGDLISFRNVKIRVLD